MNQHYRFCVLLIVVFFSIIYLAYGNENLSKPYRVLPSEDGVQRVDIKVDSYSFEPNYIIVSANKPIEITLRSVTKIIPHTFILNYPEAGLDIKQEVRPHKDATFTFTPTKVGEYEFYCGKKGLLGNHRKKGMEGILVVKD